MRQKYKQLIENDYEKEAIEYIKKNEPDSSYAVLFSGGKDSIVLYDLAKKAGVKILPIYAKTGIDPPEIVRFIKKNYPEITHAIPKISFLKYIKKYGVIPSPMRRWCCNVLKEIPSTKIMQAHNIFDVLVGIRAEESSKRAKRGRESTVHVWKGHTNLFKPIFYWQEWQVWEYIEKYKLEYPSLYDNGFTRIGCILCPFASKKEKHFNAKAYPSMYRLFLKCVLEGHASYCKRRNKTEEEEKKLLEHRKRVLKEEWGYSEIITTGREGKKGTFLV